MAIDISPPLDSQIEVTLLGSGYGESVLIHVGDNNWIIVDSCIKPGKSTPAALDYLSSIGVDPKESVVLIIATHWHDDHIRGLSQIVNVCENAMFSCPIAFSEKEFISVVAKYNKKNNTISGSGAKEIYEIYSLLKERRAKLAVANTRIYSVNNDKTVHGHPISAWALSPSDNQVDAFLLGLTKLMPQLHETSRRATTLSPNHCSMVNLIEIGPLGILLGADLEEEEVKGWSEIVEHIDSQHNKAMIFKVAHHGSSNAHHVGVWEELLTESSYALITPWNRSAGLPTMQDIDRIISFTEKGYLTSTPGKLASKISRDPVVDRMIKDTTGSKLRRSEPAFGIIRMRSQDSDLSEWSVELSDSALPLNRLKTA